MKQIALNHTASLREKMAWKIVDILKPVYMIMRVRRKAWKITQAELKTFPSESLGSDLYLFLEKNKLQLMPKAEFHDVYHVILHFGTSMREEACIQYVPLGNGRFSLPLIACCITSTIFYPEYWSDFYAAFQKGRRARRFHNWDFEDLLSKPTKELQNIIFGT